MSKVNNKELRQSCRSGIFIVNFEHISHVDSDAMIFGYTASLA